MKTLTIEKTQQGQVHCPICTHTVSAHVQVIGRRARTVIGQKCPRCSSSLDAGLVLQIPQAA